MNEQNYWGNEGFARFAERIGLSVREQKKRLQLLHESFMPFLVTPYYAELIARQAEPYKTQMLNIILPFDGKKAFEGRFDPYGNTNVQQGKKSFLQHKYEKTLLVHLVDSCVSNCQFCYKVNEIRSKAITKTSFDEIISEALSYLIEHPEIDNVLLSGGDPATIKKERLVNFMQKLFMIENIRVVRLATKAIVFKPEIFHEECLINLLKEISSKSGKKITFIVQINHPGEFCEEIIRTLRKLQEAGIQIRGQPTIARGVNDNVDTLAELQRRFVDNGIISYYLTVFMPVKGVEQYAMPLDEVFGLVSESKRRLNGLEKKGILLASHDFGKFEICGFLPTIENPKSIVLKWHQAAMSKYLPNKLKKTISTRPEDLLILQYRKNSVFCIDHLFKINGLPYIDSNNNLIN